MDEPEGQIPDQAGNIIMAYLRHTYVTYGNYFTYGTYRSRTSTYYFNPTLVAQFVTRRRELVMVIDGGSSTVQP